ncbi:MAG: hypothetical protein P8M68_00675 [Aquiluna sp.]|nr:hypothetical protein [Aquiluna sp.]
MIEIYFYILAWYSFGAGLLLISMGLFRRGPSGLSLSIAASVEAGLVVQLILSAVLVFGGQTAAIDTWEFFGYLIVALIIPLGGVIWALVERDRWSTVIMGASLLVIAVMLVRMNQIWTGENPFVV